MQLKKLHVRKLHIMFLLLLFIQFPISASCIPLENNFRFQALKFETFPFAPFFTNPATLSEVFANDIMPNSSPHDQKKFSWGQLLNINFASLNISDRMGRPKMRFQELGFTELFPDNSANIQIQNKIPTAFRGNFGMVGIWHIDANITSGITMTSHGHHFEEFNRTENRETKHVERKKIVTQRNMTFIPAVSFQWNQFAMGFTLPVALITTTSSGVHDYSVIPFLKFGMQFQTKMIGGEFALTSPVRTLALLPGQLAPPFEIFAGIATQPNATLRLDATWNFETHSIPFSQSNVFKLFFSPPIPLQGRHMIKLFSTTRISPAWSLGLGYFWISPLSNMLGNHSHNIQISKEWKWANQNLVLRLNLIYMLVVASKTTKKRFSTKTYANNPTMLHFSFRHKF